MDNGDSVHLNEPYMAPPAPCDRIRRTGMGLVRQKDKKTKRQKDKKTKRQKDKKTKRYPCLWDKRKRKGMVPHKNLLFRLWLKLPEFCPKLPKLVPCLTCHKGGDIPHFQILWITLDYVKDHPFLFLNNLIPTYQVNVKGCKGCNLCNIAFYLKPGQQNFQLNLKEELHWKNNHSITYVRGTAGFLQLKSAPWHISI